MSGTPHRGLNKEEVDWFFRETDVLNMQYSQLMAMVTWAKKSSSKSANIAPKVHIVATWETIKKLKNSTPLGDSSWHALPNLPKLADILA